VNVGLNPRPDFSNQEVLSGLIERVTFHNAENGFCGLRVKARGHRELVTVVGHAATIPASEWITASGEWVKTAPTASSSKPAFYAAGALSASHPTAASGSKPGW
jgi:exodeoxyribonuclease V alpha subunit